MKKNRQIVENADNKILMPLADNDSVVGYVDEVNGTDAAEVSGFVPTRHELIQLAEYWERTALETQWWFITGQVSSGEIRLEPYALRRVNRICSLIGQEEVRQAIDRVFAEFGKDMDPRLWNIFLHGDEAQRRAVHEETWRQIEEEDSRRQATARHTEPLSQESDEPG